MGGWVRWMMIVCCEMNGRMTQIAWCRFCFPSLSSVIFSATLSCVIICTRPAGSPLLVCDSGSGSSSLYLQLLLAFGRPDVLGQRRPWRQHLEREPGAAQPVEQRQTQTRGRCQHCARGVDKQAGREAGHEHMSDVAPSLPPPAPPPSHLRTVLASCPGRGPW